MLFSEKLYASVTPLASQRQLPTRDQEAESSAADKGDEDEISPGQ